jgi:uncharacterized protein (DUF1810 family)
MGSRIDALKLVSSLTLFRAAAERLATADPAFARSFAALVDVILKHAATQGYPPCARTLSLL